VLLVRLVVPKGVSGKKIKRDSLRYEDAVGEIEFSFCGYCGVSADDR
jgi:hypothetical protein